MTKNYGSKEGLSHSITTSILQDRQGFLWIGTYSGLNRFDGHNFETFSTKDNLVYDAVRAIAEGRDGSIWVGTEQGLSRFQNGKFTKPKDESENATKDIRKLVVDQNGTVVIGAVNRLFLFKEERFIEIKLDTDMTENSNDITALFVDETNKIWIGTEKGIKILSNEKLDKQNISHKIFSDYNILSIKKHSKNSILVSTKGNGIYEVTGETVEPLSNEYIEFLDKKEDWMVNQFHREQHVFTSNKGDIVIFHGKKHSVRLKSSRFKDVTGSFVDREDNIWLYTSGHGLWKLYKRKVQSITNQLPERNIRYIFKDSSNQIWIGTNSNITLWDGKKEFTDIRKKGSRISKVRAIVEDKNKTIWFGTDNGLFCWKDETLKPVIVKEFSSDSIYFLTVFGDSLLIAFNGGKFFKYNTTDGKATEFIKDNKPGIVWYVQSDIEQKNVIIQGPNGVIKCDQKENCNFLHSKEIGSNVKYEKILYFSETDYILALNEKVEIVKDKTSQIFELPQSIKNAQITSLLRDSNGSVWVGTTRGVVKYNPQDKTNIIYDKDDGLAGDNSAFHAILEDNGKVYVGSSNGISIFDIKNEIKNLNKPIPAITKIVINNTNEIFPGYDYQKNILGDVIGELHNLSNNENDIQIYFSSLSFVRPERVKYEYRLNGFDKDWVKSVSRNFAVYNNIPPGEYAFEIKSSNNDGIFSQDARNFKISIEPAFYQTKWFYGLMGIFFLLGVYGIIKLRIRQIELRNKELEHLVQERTKELVIERDKSESLLLNILPVAIADELKQNNVSEPKLYQAVTVVFTDFVGFTGISEKMTPKDLVKELNDYFIFFDSVLDRHNLEKMKTIGDGYMAAGGIPTSNKTHAVDCVLAFQEVQRFVSEKNEHIPHETQKWSLRIGIHTGSLIAGVIGKKKFTYDIWGDTVNTASRLESSGMPNRINISQQTYDLVKPFFDCEARGKIIAKGKGNLDMYFILGIKKELSKDGLGIEPNAQFWNLYNKLKDST